MWPAASNRPDGAVGTRALPAAPPPTPPSTSDAEWDELTFASFGPRYWNLGCG